MEIILEIQFYLGNNINSDFDVTKINVYKIQCSLVLLILLVMDLKINFPFSISMVGIVLTQLGI